MSRSSMIRSGFFASWALALSALFGNAAQAACDSGLAERLHARLHPNLDLDHALAICEPWRGHPGRSIVVLPLLRTGSNGESRLDAEVLVVQQPDNGNSERSSIVGWYFESNMPAGIADQITEIRIDSTRYMLAPDAHAFALRTRRRGGTDASSDDTQSASETLMLFQLQGQHLVKLLDETEMEYSSHSESASTCSGVFHTRRSQLSVARTLSNGLADLTLQRTESGSRNSMLSEECSSQRRPDRRRVSTLHFNGRRYQAVD